MKFAVEGIDRVPIRAGEDAIDKGAICDLAIFEQRAGEVEFFDGASDGVNAVVTTVLAGFTEKRLAVRCRWVLEKIDKSIVHGVEYWVWMRMRRCCVV